MGLFCISLFGTGDVHEHILDKPPRFLFLFFFFLFSPHDAVHLTIMYMSDEPMGSMSIGGVPSLFYLQKIYWIIVGSVLAAATLVNLLNRLLAQHR